MAQPRHHTGALQTPEEVSIKGEGDSRRHMIINVIKLGSL